MPEMIYFDFAGARYFGNGLSAFGMSLSHFHNLTYRRLSALDWPLMTRNLRIPNFLTAYYIQLSTAGRETSAFQISGD